MVSEGACQVAEAALTRTRMNSEHHLRNKSVIKHLIHTRQFTCIAFGHLWYFFLKQYTFQTRKSQRKKKTIDNAKKSIKRPITPSIGISHTFNISLVFHKLLIKMVLLVYKALHILLAFIT